MYDTVNFWIGWTGIGGYSQISVNHLLNVLTNVTEHENRDRGRYITGSLQNYIVLINQAGISLKGSLAKFYLQNNIQTLTRAETEKAIDKLSNTLQLPMLKAKVTRIDVSTVLITKKKPSDYYHYLGNKTRSTRLQTAKDTLSYITKEKKLVFYDKVLEAKASKTKIPDCFNGCNLLRVELKWTSRLPSKFKLPEITGATLIDEEFYKEMIKRWGDEYFSINKLKSNSIMNTEKIKTPKDGSDAIFSLLLQEKGQEYIDQLITDLKANNVYKDPKYYSRVKETINKLTKSSPYLKHSALIEELDMAVNDIVKNWN